MPISSNIKWVSPDTTEINFDNSSSFNISYSQQLKQTQHCWIWTTVTTTIENHTGTNLSHCRSASKNISFNTLSIKIPTSKIKEILQSWSKTINLTDPSISLSFSDNSFYNYVFDVSPYRPGEVSDGYYCTSLDNYHYTSKSDIKTQLSSNNFEQDNIYNQAINLLNNDYIYPFATLSHSYGTGDAWNWYWNKGNRQYICSSSAYANCLLLVTFDLSKYVLEVSQSSDSINYQVYATSNPFNFFYFEYSNPGSLHGSGSIYTSGNFWKNNDGSTSSSWRNISHQEGGKGTGTFETHYDHTIDWYVSANSYPAWAKTKDAKNPLIE